MQEKTLNTRRVFEGRVLTLEVQEVELADGTRSTRELVRHPGAVVVLARRADGRFLFVRQYRKAVERVMLEAVAGTREPDEDWAPCAARELGEETGHRAVSLRPLGRLVPAPGYTSEVLHVFYADAEPGTDARPDADERLETVALTADEIEALIARGALEDAKTLAAWLLYTRSQTP